MDRDNNIQEPIFSIDIEEKFDSVKDVNRFIKYCFIYDPLVDLNTGKKQHLFINPDRLPGHYFDSKLDKTKIYFIQSYANTQSDKVNRAIY